MQTATRTIVLGLLVLLLCGYSSGMPMESFDGAAAWINSPALHPDDLRGKVVLVDFWEYTCLNCLRTLPYLREWYKRYHGDGLVIVGVHAPEFGFSAQPAQVEAATKRLDVTWPVAVDSSYAIWKRYGVTGWPTELLFNQNGVMVDSVYGEGDYQQTEAHIQALLKTANPSLTLPPVMDLLPQDNYLKPGAVCYPHTPEILVEHTPIADAPAFGNPATDLDYHDPGGTRRDGAIDLNGFWHATRQAVAFGGGNGYFDLSYRAIEVTVVMTPGNSGGRVVVTQDGQPIAHDDAGPDVRYDANGTSYVDVNVDRAYHIIENHVYGQHDLRLSPGAYGLAIYDLDFESCEVPGTR
ncbi:MAG TPA: thioredoxin-like domain-containing protein [Candidatus Acidoferrales bacterium]|nr:thioredoxin-like domain-containing protein [Candidatus Acidoferrales bacterium]